ncbi:MAG: GNAT family N-acetyltransferase [Candidatus Omnitrophota bacterium]
MIEYVKWDSEFFGIKIGKTRLDAGNFDRAGFIEERDKGGFGLIYGLADAGQHARGPWESAGFRFADCLITASMGFDAGKYVHTGHELLANPSKDDLAACYEIAEAIAPASRFYYESAIGEQLTKKLYRKWIDTALDGTFSDGILVERIAGKIAGINAIRTEKDAGVCTLIGVKDEFRGKGIGRKLWEQAFAYWAHKAAPGINMVNVRFSAGNAPAFGFYIATGFDKVEKADYIYHWSKA